MGHPTNTERSYWRKAAMPNADWLLISFHSVSSRWCGLGLAQQIATADIVVKASVVSRNVDNVILIMSTMLFGIMMTIVIRISLMIIPLIWLIIIMIIIFKKYMTMLIHTLVHIMLYYIAVIYINDI